MSADISASFAADIEKAAGSELIEAVVIGKREDADWNDWDPRFAPADARVDEPLTWAEARPLLDYQYDHGFGGQDCHYVEAFTATRVLFLHEYDGATWIASVQRHPTTPASSLSALADKPPPASPMRQGENTSGAKGNLRSVPQPPDLLITTEGDQR